MAQIGYDGEKLTIINGINKYSAICNGGILVFSIFIFFLLTISTVRLI